VRKNAHVGLCTAAIAIWLWNAIGLAQPTAAAPEQPSAPPNLGLYKIELTRYRESGRYESGLAAVAGQAKAWLARRASRKGKLAMVLDIDETSLSNWPVIKADDFGFIPRGPCDLSKSDLPQGACGWFIWISQGRDQPIRPTLELYRQARSLGLAVFFITGRPEFLREATERNLRAAGYDEWKDLMMVPKGFKMKSAADFKAPARQRIAGQGYSIIVNMGDQDSDLAGGYAERTFKLPDPFYYIP
jgi:acid phosphatase